MEEHTQPHDGAERLKSQILKIGDEAKALNAWIVEQEAIIKQKKKEHREMVSQLRHLIKNERENAGRVFLAPSQQKPAMHSRLYGHAIEEAGHRAFANAL
jgi:thiamine kinase-like enzyme